MNLHRQIARRIVDRLYLSMRARLRNELLGDERFPDAPARSGQEDQSPWGHFRTNAEHRPTIDPMTILQNEVALLRWNVKVLAGAIAQNLPSRPSGENYERVHVGLGSRLCRQSDMEAEWMQYWRSRLWQNPNYHRKFWEWGYVLQVLWEAGMIAPNKRGLVFAAGQEPLPAYLAGQGVDILASDLDNSDLRSDAWRASNEHADGLDALFFSQFVSRDVFLAKCSFRWIDMNDIPRDLDGKFDFCWSVCAAEHVGRIDLSLRFVENSLRCLKPGGVAVHTIEFNLDSSPATIDNGPTVLLKRQHIDLLAQRLAAQGHVLSQVDYDGGTGVLDSYIDPHPYTLPSGAFLRYPDVPHLRLSVDQFPATSIGLVIRTAA